MISAVFGLWAMGLLVAALFTEVENRRERYLFYVFAIIVYYLSLVILKAS